MIREDVNYIFQFLKKYLSYIGIGLAIIGGALAISWMMRSTDFYKHSVDIAVNDRRVVQALGEPVQTGWWVMGEISSGGMSSEGDLRIPLKGSRGKGTLFAAGRVDAGLWTYFNLVVHISSTGEVIDLRR